MTPRQRWAIAWRTARWGTHWSEHETIAVVHACRGSGNTTGRPSKRVPLASISRSPRWFYILSFTGPRNSRDEWVELLRENLRQSRANRGEALP